MPRCARDEDFEDDNGRNREQHPEYAKQDGAIENADHHDYQVELDDTANDPWVVEDVFEQLGKSRRHNDPDPDALNVDGGQQRPDLLRQEDIP